MAKKRTRRTVTQKRQQNNVKANTKYKDTIFRMLFSDRKNLLSLYNAISGKAYEDPDKLEIVTLKNAIYMGIYNDLAFIIDTNLFLYEHQSTYNPNIPLRDLFYIADEYQKVVVHKSLYSSALQKIPAPNFLVFYNGTQKKEEQWENCLSDAFENLNGEPKLELKVTTLNVNEGHNRKLMEQCQILKEYAQYVARVRSYTAAMQLEDAVDRAVNECIQENILKEFLMKNKAEVIAVSIFEYNKEEEEKKLRKAEFDYGLEQGIRRGMQQGMQQGLERGDLLRVIKQTLKKIQKGCTSEETADMLEVDQSVIEQIYQIAAEFAPDYNENQICEVLLKKQ